MKNLYQIAYKVDKGSHHEGEWIVSDSIAAIENRLIKCYGKGTILHSAELKSKDITIIK